MSFREADVDAWEILEGMERGVFRDLLCFEISLCFVVFYLETV